MDGVQIQVKQVTRILIVDDDAMNREIMEAYLMIEQYDVALAHNGRQALSLVKELQPDLVILDVKMPDINGYDVCRQIRADENLENVRVLIMTGYDEESDRQRGMEAGADAFLTRPFDGNTLYEQVRELTRTAS